MNIPAEIWDALDAADSAICEWYYQRESRRTTEELRLEMMRAWELIQAARRVAPRPVTPLCLVEDK